AKRNAHVRMNLAGDVNLARVVAGIGDPGLTVSRSGITYPGHSRAIVLRRIAFSASHTSISGIIDLGYNVVFGADAHSCGRRFVFMRGPSPRKHSGLGMTAPIRSVFIRVIRGSPGKRRAEITGSPPGTSDSSLPSAALPASGSRG